MDKLRNNNKENAPIEYPYPQTPPLEAGEDVESNKSTPYFTPLEFLQTSFEFPSPTAEGGVTVITEQEDQEEEVFTPRQFTVASPHPAPHVHHPPSSQSPTLNRKFKRFSLYDRRSCSPHITSSANEERGSVRGTDKENTMPKGGSDDHELENTLYLSKSEHNSPTILFKDESSSTPGLEASRLSYSPKLLSSINNLNVSGSPLNIINSAGYKNGNFFRFPEIDHVVQVAPVDTGCPEEPPRRDRSPALSEPPEHQQQKSEGRKNRKNKNNLTIRITDVPIKNSSQASPLPKPKTPTIKSTKEKARSLDSAANESELSIVVHNITESHGSCDDMESGQIKPSTSIIHHLHLQQPAFAIHSTSLSRTPRRKSPGINTTDWLMYHRKQNPYQVPSPHCSSTAQSSLDSDASLTPSLGDSELKSACSVDGGSKFGMGASLAPRSAHKHNQLLHSSSTNLKTLPECLTLVEFSSGGGPKESPFKQKSMDLPMPALQAKATVSTSSMNLLQRRGSNHSLTLNLHSSCGNLMNSGLSHSNYSLGSILNSKSSCNLDASTSNQVRSDQQPQTLLLASSQGSRQGLFRRRGSNHSITLKTGHTTTSCGDLNSMHQLQQQQAMLSAEKYNRLNMRTNSTGSGSGSGSNVPTPKRGLLERRGSNQSLTLNMGNILGGGVNTEIQVQDMGQPKVTVCSCAATNQASHQRKFFSTENLNSSKVNNQKFFGQVCFGSASDLQPNPQQESASSDQGIVTTCTCAGTVRNIMTRPLSPQTTSEEFKIYLASIQMLQSASNPLNQFDLIRLNYVFDHSYQTNRNVIEQPPGLGANARDLDTPTDLVPPSSEDSELLACYHTVVKRIVQSIPELEETEQKRIFRDLHKEFWDLPLNHQEKPMVFGSQTKNRYKTILPNEHSRVLLETESSELISLQEEVKRTGSMTASEDVPYINANYIKGPDYVSKCYVATQGPLPNTVFEFWLMIYQNTQRYIRRCVDGGSSSSPHMDRAQILQQYFQKIVMLTNFTEANRQKCAVYFPIDLNEIFAVAAKCEVFQLSSAARDYFNRYLTPTFVPDTMVASSEAIDYELCGRHIGVESVKVTLEGDLLEALPVQGSFFLIKNVGIVRRNGYSVRKLVLLYCIRVPQSTSYYLQKIFCYHYWYPDWPDHHSPRDINTLLDTCLHVLNLGKCESEFDNYDECRSERNAHLGAQRLEIYQQDIFNAVQPLPVIHCSAGIGRTGCFTAILNAVRQLRQSLAYSLTGMLTKTLTSSMAEEYQCPTDSDSSFTCNTIRHIRHILDLQESEAVETPPSFDRLPKMPDIFVDVLGIVCNLRLQRGGMVQNSEQYELIHRAICLYLKRTLALRRF
ncbi:uncharacterized protein LOC108109196 [Drosophila eugracilis]|uniref:uncharacterized protein LOC108109196 n=1 Tax=Drosophila eugracilis TaxID=29029 RepID=UPI0007E8529A|nr:uncharacterized protein LOC108109196 [Drosophila eugracilis]XP_017073120.1 uncharacterized protein LOC108109196 [Drosophila eugracilis]